MTRCWDGPFGAVSPLDAPSWFTALPRHHRQHPVPGPPRVRQPLQQEHPGALGQAHPVRRRRKRLAPPVGGQAPLPGEPHQLRRGGHHRHPARQRQGALPAPQRLARQVQRDQRGRARGVHRHRGPFQPEQVRHPAGQHAGRGPGQQMPLQPLHPVQPVQPLAVVRRSRAHEDPARRTAQRPRVDPGPLDRLPADFEQQPLLRVHGQRLPRADPEKPRVEVTRPGHEPALAGVRGPGMIRIGVIQALGIPAPVGREPADRIGPRRQRPTAPAGSAPRREPAADPDDRDRLPGRRGRRGNRRRPGRLSHQPGPQEPRQDHRGRVVKGQRGGQPQPGRGLQPVPQLDRGQRVKPDLAEGPARLHRLGRGVPQHRGGVRPDQAGQHPVPVRPRQPRQLTPQRHPSARACWPARQGPARGPAHATAGAAPAPERRPSRAASSRAGTSSASSRASAASSSARVTHATDSNAQPAAADPGQVPRRPGARSSRWPAPTGPRPATPRAGPLPPAGPRPARPGTRCAAA